MTVLRDRLRNQAADVGLNLGDLTVLAPQNDPYRYDTPAGHRLAAWFAELFKAHVSPSISIHLRGFHYVLLGVPKPDGTPYSNTDRDWTWLCKVSQIARWLDRLPFERIHDQRNDAPEDLTVEGKSSPGQGSVDIVGGFIGEPELSLDWIRPTVWASAPSTPQPYRIVFCGEKSSLGRELYPVAARVLGELILPMGEMSDTLIAGIASRAAADGRPTVVLYASDFDPSGHQMARSVARKLQALRDLRFSGLQIEVHRIALTLDQCVAHDLPSTPLKETERRADNWRRQTGREQTELDALLALHPGALRRIFEDAIKPFHDPTIDRRADEACRAWAAEARERLMASDGYQAACELLEAARTAAADDLAAARELIETARAAIEHAKTTAARMLPRISGEIPPVEPIIEAIAPQPLFTTSDDYPTATLRLIADKRLDGGTT